MLPLLAVRMLLASLCVLLFFHKAHGTVTAEAVDKAIHLVQQELNLIYNRYEMFKPIGNAFFLMQHNLSPRDFEMLKLQFSVKLLTPGASYTMLFGGSSVTAGHDNLEGQAYPHVIEKKMAPLLKAVGIDLKVRNIAQGANSCIPSDLCYSSMGGYRADVVGWEQTFNCGTERNIMELMHRTAYWSKGDGEIGSVYMAASGSGFSYHCNETDFGKPYSDEDWKPSDDNLADWIPNEDTIANWVEKLSPLMTMNGPAFRDGVVEAYRDVGVAISSFQYSRKHFPWWCKSIYGDNHSRATPHYVFHSAARPDRWSCEAEKIYQRCAIKFLRKESSIYGRLKKRNHHPPRAHHMMRAEFFVFHYGMALLDAFFTVRKDLGYDGGISLATDDAVNKSLTNYSNKLTDLAPKFYEPLFNPTNSEKYHTLYRPECYTDFRPHYNNELVLSNQIVGQNGWELHTPTRPIPDETFYESRPLIKAVNGSRSGELSLSVNITEVSKHIMLCALMSVLEESMVDIRVELHVDLNRLNSAYVPMASMPSRRLLEGAGGVEDHHPRHKNHRKRFPGLHLDYYAFNHTFHDDGRVIWANMTRENNCLVLNYVPVGQHVLGVQSRGDQKKAVYLSHMIVIR